ncbi:hypothetical protein B0I33_102646 [Prauserella shujinwangii]|uniref:PPE family protein n=1 Tax=Prauserella shujinwangii TaxID=1453103 RepID=A0A2T0M1P0_9PSEU|nr:hypothetical protein [Prauserella shujinwangii]PRX50524.1 hypothetical protein B0I33_102646 [Prauserella shujinwangii]
MEPNTPEQQGAGNVPLGDNSEVAQIVDQARGRADGFLYGDDRAIADRPNWAAQESEQLYRAATLNNDPGSAEATGQGWASHSRELQQAADDLYNAISELGAAWVGQGAGAAQGALVAIANSGSQASEAAHTMSHRLAQQAAAAAEVKKMPEPVEFDPAAETAAMLAGGPAAMVKDLKPKFDAAREVKAQQVAYMEAYTTALSEIDNTTPSFGPESLGLRPNAGRTDLNAGQVGTVAAFGGPSGSLAGPDFGGIGSAPPLHASSAMDGSASGFAGGAHGGQPAAGAGQGLAAGQGPAAGPGAGSAAGAAQGGAAPGGSGSLAPTLGGAAVGGAVGALGARALAKGNRSGSTKQQSSETNASANMQPNSAASVAPQNQGLVPGSGTIGAGAAPPPATAPMGGMGAAGAGQQKEEEHTHASFLIEPDPDDAFGANEATPPPVIGAWGDDAEER